MASPKQNPAIALRLVGNQLRTFHMDVSLWGLAAGGRIELSFIEVGSDDGSGQGDRILGTAAGTIVPASDGKAFSYSFTPDEPAPVTPADAKVKIAFSFAKPGAIELASSPSEAPQYVFALSDDALDVNEGDFWEVQIRAESLDIASQVVPLARIRRQLEGQPCTYDWHDGHHIEIYHDGSEDDHGAKGAFADVQSAIAAAQHLILVVDWSFQPMHRLTRVAPAGPGDTVGAQLVGKARVDKNLLVAIHSWNHTYPFAQDTQNDDADAALNAIARGMGVGLEKRPDNLLWRATSREGSGWSHHQKFLIVDCDAGGSRRDLKVFFGGLDLTKGRFDWPKHYLSTRNRTQVWPFVQSWNTQDNAFKVDDWYNSEFDGNTTLPRQPWHDIYMSAQGPCAWDFLREFVGRWTHTPSMGGNTGDTGSDHVEAVWKKYRQLRDDRKTFVQPFEGKRDGIWGLQVYRSLSSAHWAPPGRKPRDQADKSAFASVSWKANIGKAENSIQRAYQQAIGQAEKFIYIENQYLIGSGRRWQGKKSTITNDIPGCLVDKIIERAKAGKPFHVYVIKPMFPEGKPVDGSTLEIRKNEWMTAQYMVQTLAKEFGKDWIDYLSFYFLANWAPQTPVNKGSREERVRGNDRYMVYVHSKFMIVDDRYFILGSANLNERSLNGDRDSEIACGVWPGHGHDAEALEKIRGFRTGIWQSHFGSGVVSPDSPESPACVSSVRHVGDQNYASFRTLTTPPNGHACRWPFGLNSAGLLRVEESTQVFDDTTLLPDSPEKDKKWKWDSPGVWYIKELAQ
jgi:phospholipase D1/2